MWYYLKDGQQQGPVEDAGMDALMAEGVVHSDTQVWKEGQAEWLPFHQARGGPGSLSGVVDRTAICEICNKSVGADNLIELAGVKVCAACKPLALQTMREGAELSGNGMAWCEGKKLVTRDNTYLPKRCLKCNATTELAPLKRKVYWHNPLVYLVIFINIILYAIVAALVRKKATIYVHLCAHHFQRRKNFILGGWSGTALGIITCVVGVAYGISWAVIAGSALILVAIIAGIAGATVTRTARIKDKSIWIRGAGKEFLASLPPWVGTPG